jgi:hypothetical protein
MMQEQAPAQEVRSERKLGRIELIDRSERDCDFPGCHLPAVLRCIDYGGGREYVGEHHCGFHGAALYGLRQA